MAWINRVPTSTYRQSPKRSAARPPTLEPLEDRQLLSTCHVTRLTDQGIGKGFRGDLRYCINKVNAEPGADLIFFHVTGSINLNNALPQLTSEIDIQGPGAALLTINAQRKARVFYVNPNANIEISGLTMRGGDSKSPNFGGGIYNLGDLTLQDCAVIDNIGWKKGGGIYSEGDLSISNCSISANFNDHNTAPYEDWGGGIYNASTGSLIVNNSHISNNLIEPSLSYIAYGGGLANLGRAIIRETTILGNNANLIDRTSWGGVGGGIYNGGDLLVEQSLIASNSVIGDFFAFGGGIANGLIDELVGEVYYKPSGVVTVVNSTINGNLAHAYGDLGYGLAQGGGINSTNGGLMTIQHSTIVGNRLDYWHEYVAGFGGGVASKHLSKNTTSPIHISNSIVANNETFHDGPNVYGDLTSSSFNLYGDPSGGTGYSGSDLLNADPLLGPLQDNGGTTLTMALLPGSPAIDAGDNTDAPEWDQRGPGFPRIVNGTIDIGAFEVQATPIPSHTRPGCVLLALVLATVDLDALT